MIFDIAARPAVSATSVSTQSSQSMAEDTRFMDELALMDGRASPLAPGALNSDEFQVDGVGPDGTGMLAMADSTSFADELALMNGTVPMLRSGPVSNADVIQAAALMAEESGEPPMTGGTKESVPMTAGATRSMVKALPEFQFGLVSNGTPPAIDSHSMASSPTHARLSTSAPPSLGKPGRDDPWKMAANEDHLGLTGRGAHEPRLSRGHDRETSPPPMERRVPASPASHRSPVRDRFDVSDFTETSRRAVDDRHPSVGLMPFTERLTELSMMVAVLRSDESDTRIASKSLRHSSVLAEMTVEHASTPAIHTSISSWTMASADEVGPRESSFEASDDDSIGSDPAETVDGSTGEPPYSMLSSLIAQHHVVRSSDIERMHHVHQIPEPVRVTVEHLRSLLPEGGRLLEVQPHLVRLEVVHSSGPIQLEVAMRSGIVDVSARGVGAAEMAWRVPELAAALQSTGMRLGTFDVQPARRGKESSSSDRGHTDHRQDLDGAQEETVQNVPTASRRASR
jgi:hypothetical protein